ncbi:YjeF family N-terminal domain/YjeF family C-terminal domain containing protein [Trypanosoma brucei equiperdum]|uniref:Bifunctional NAD(P)H-hydrate repair enzyme n=1 Tax=Trypanosoma brucei equiperdum TaxID=630700 RepID=A0A3L6L5Y7_9TRYP|nr:YjeF family N-terminal domain/YjeF family C-terminal domain containing protein [Trypanosoma brucei equiperdum]
MRRRNSFIRTISTYTRYPDEQQKLLYLAWSAAWLRKAEVEAARVQGITLYDLMQRAAAAFFKVVCTEVPNAKKWLVLCGSGNNGGDGFEVARRASSRGGGTCVTVITVAGSKPLPPEAAAAYAALQEERQKPGVEIVMKDARTWLEEGASLSGVDVVVDGLLGTGMGGAPRGDYAAIIDRVNESGKPCFAIDIPSGLDAETGDVKGSCIRAVHTVTFIAVKPGLLTGSARNHVGKLHYDSLDLADWLLLPDQQRDVFCRRLESSHLFPLLSRSEPRRCINKAMNGKLLVVGGDSGFGGAIAMAAEAALRSGCGLVRVLTRAEHAAPIMCRCPEVMTQTLTEESLRMGLQWASCVAIGPGLGQGAWGIEALRVVEIHLRENINIPSVWDADALNILATFSRKRNDGEQQPPSVRLNNRVITPHSAEASRLLGCTVSEVEQNRYRAAEELVARYGGVVLLKGPGTVLRSAEDARVPVPTGTAAELLFPACAVADVGNSGMASGGMGDVLTGIIAGLLAQQFPLWQATCAGCLVHGTAADLAASSQGGERGLTATTLFKYLPVCLNPTPEGFQASQCYL